MKATTETLPLAPRMLGDLLYPFGAPMRPENVSYEGRTIKELIFLRANEEQWTPEETEFIKQYIIYYVHAPVFKLNPDEEYMNELYNSLSLEMSVDDLIYKCMEYGLDPL